ncbi:MAG TPA: sulfotransferase family 2 domain-containing protein [Pirellulaceae bacterium]|nr:sulfotransferase family 2 domain-containing protein [Pirellulaceae bacterium]
MILSHKYKFIFIKTLKTAGTSIETYLSQVCGEDDIVTPIYPHVEPHSARNFAGHFNPLPEIVSNRRNWSNLRQTFGDLCEKKKFYNHIPARLIRSRVPARIWNTYFKFCIERNPWDKTVSHYYMQKYRSNGSLTLEQYFEQKCFCLNYPIYANHRDDLLVDRVLKFEDLNSSLNSVFSDLNVPFAGTLQIKAKSEYRDQSVPYAKILSDEQRDIIGDVFAKEIEMHGYGF